jgi:hypothetical protein
MIVIMAFAFTAFQPGDSYAAGKAAKKIKVSKTYLKSIKTNRGTIAKNGKSYIVTLPANQSSVKLTFEKANKKARVYTIKARRLKQSADNETPVASPDPSPTQETPAPPPEPEPSPPQKTPAAKPEPSPEPSPAPPASGQEPSPSGSPEQDTDDIDNDGLSGYMETLLGTDSHKPDTDDDGMSDFDEFVNGMNPLASDAYGDIDCDGLRNIDELNIYFTSPCNPDSDDDGLNDYDEIFAYDTDPATRDTDNDGASDGLEVSSGFDPLVYNSTFDITKSVAGDNGFTASVKVTLSGSQAETLSVEDGTDGIFFDDTPAISERRTSSA